MPGLRAAAHDIALNALRENAVALRQTARELREFGDSRTALLHERAAQKLDQWIRHFDSQHKRGNDAFAVRRKTAKERVDTRITELQKDDEKWETYFSKKSRPFKWDGPTRDEDDEPW